MSVNPPRAYEIISMKNIYPSTYDNSTMIFQSCKVNVHLVNLISIQAQKLEDKLLESYASGGVSYRPTPRGLI